MTQKNAIEIKNLTVSYGNKPVLWDITATLPKGKMIAIVGPNGGGKTTLLKSIMGLIPIDGGNITFSDTTLDAIRGEIGYMGQRQSIDWNFPINAYDVVMMGRYPHMGFLKRASKEDHEKVKKALDLVQMYEKREKPIGSLSIGQQQRVFLARAFAQEAHLYILDEPLAGVDASTSNLVLSLLNDLTKKGKTVVMIHHNLSAIHTLFHHVLLINTRLYGAGKPSEILVADRLKFAYGQPIDLFEDVKSIWPYIKDSIIKEKRESHYKESHGKKK